MIGQYTRIFMVVTMVTLAMTHVSKASCKVGDTVIEVGKSYKSPPPGCKVYRCKEGDILTKSQSSVCALLAIEDEECCYGHETYTRLIRGCECQYAGCKAKNWYHYIPFVGSKCS